jgi:hypothetical protein
MERFTENAGLYSFTLISMYQMFERQSWVEKAIPSHIYQTYIGDTYTRLVLSIIFAWGFFDTVTTFIAIAAYGTMKYELNPITAWMLSVHPMMLVVGKFVAVSAVGFLALYGQGSIKEVYGWKSYFRGIVVIGVLVGVMNLYAAMTAATGFDPIFS